MPVFGNSFPFPFHGTSLWTAQVLASFNPLWPLLNLIAAHLMCSLANLAG
jgi:hypothetical protein